MQRSVLVAAFAATFLVACPNPQDRCPTALCELDAAATSNDEFTSPFDATLSPDGKIAYFTAVTPNGPGILATTVGSQINGLLVSGEPLASPMALDVTSNGQTLYIADASAEQDDGNIGRLFSMGVKGENLTAIDSTAGYRPRGLTVVLQGTDQVYFSGNDPADGQPGVFKVAVGANTVTAVAKGEPLIDPSGIVVAKNGDIYVADTSDSATTAQILKISGNTVEPLLRELRLGYPAGIAISYDQSLLLVSALDKDTGKDVVIKYTIKDGTIDYFNAGIGEFEESAGLHRAKDTESYVWADSLANGGGTVYVINKVE